jgi:hypothetical protein
MSVVFTEMSPFFTWISAKVSLILDRTGKRVKTKWRTIAVEGEASQHCSKADLA